MGIKIISLWTQSSAVPRGTFAEGGLNSGDIVLSVVLLALVLLFGYFLLRG